MRSSQSQLQQFVEAHSRSQVLFSTTSVSCCKPKHAYGVAMSLLDKRYQRRGSTIRPFVPLSTAQMSARDSFMALPGAINLRPQDCYICRSSDWSVISERNRYGFPYPTAICARCGNVQQSEYYDELTLNSFYGHYYRAIYEKDSTSLFERQVLRGERILSFIQDCGATPPFSVLEVGCGAGGLLSAFSNAGCEVLGLDFDESQLLRGRAAGLDVRQGSIESLPREQKFDVVILSHVLEPSVSPLQLLTEVACRTRTSGIVYIEVPSLNHVCSGGYDYDLLKYFQNAHSVHFTHLTLSLLASQAGLQSLKSDDFIRSCWPHAPNPISIGDEDFLVSAEHTRLLLREIERRRSSVRGWLASRQSWLRNWATALLHLLGLHSTVRYFLTTAGRPFSRLNGRRTPGHS